MKLLSAALFALVVFVVVRADVAPTTYAGGTLVPLEVGDLRFNDARVTITWGYPCALEAAFEIVSERKDPFTLEIGFPVGGYDPAYRDYGPQALTESVAKEPVSASIISIRINGTSVPAFRRVNIPQQCEIRFGRASWYFADVTLLPGTNRIELATSLAPSMVKGCPFERRLEYCLWTGGRWNGEIVHERVEIEFPTGNPQRFITEAKPDFFKVRDNRVVWEYSKVRPISDDYDVNVIVRLPEVVRLLEQLEDRWRQAPSDVAATIELAKHLFVLGAEQGNAGFPPEFFSATEFHALRERFSGEDRMAFERHYSIRRAREYRAVSSEWSADRRRVAQILADDGYCGNYSGVGEVLNAKRLIEDLLVREPVNEAAWLVYLGNYWRFSFGAAQGGRYGLSRPSRPQREAIEKAYRACPNSPGITTWYEFAQGMRAEPPIHEWVVSGSALDRILQAVRM